MSPRQFTNVTLLLAALAVPGLVGAEGVEKASGAGPVAAAGAGESTAGGPAIGDHVVVHHLTWLHRSPEEGSDRWADNRTRADNQTDYLVFRVTGARGEWLEVEALSWTETAEPNATCYSQTLGMFTCDGCSDNVTLCFDAPAE